MEKQTAIQKCLADWLENREAKKTDILNTIKELEKLEEIKPFNYSQWEVEMANLRRLREWKGCIDWFISSLEYHESTYVSKGSDDHIVDTNEMVNKDINYWKQNCEENYITTPISVLRYISELEKLVPISSQTEISNTEIEFEVSNAWVEYNVNENDDKDSFYAGWKLAIKWYREQLKSRQ